MKANKESYIVVKIYILALLIERILFSWKVIEGLIKDNMKEKIILIRHNFFKADYLKGEKENLSLFFINTTRKSCILKDNAKF